MGLTIIGLGSGDKNSLSLEAYEKLTQSKSVYLRTEQHPIVPFLIEKGMTYKSFDYLYEKSDTFEDVYEQIAAIITEIPKIQKEEVIYGVTGHPMVAEKSVMKIIEICEAKKIDFKVIASGSFLDDMYIFLKIDPSQGFMLVDALEFKVKDLSFSGNIIFTQVYNNTVAGDLKLKLLEIFDDEIEVVLCKAAGIKGLETKETVKLYEMDRGNFKFDNLTSLLIPKNAKRKYYSYEDFIDIISELRGENGCPWDRKQTLESLLPYLQEETQELIEAVNNNDIDNVVEELGDIFLNIVMQAQIGKEEEIFDIYEVVDTIANKIIRRHPHVFGDEVANTPEDVETIWKRVKSEEKNWNFDKIC